MALGKKTGGRDFKPGVVTNPNGRPKLPEELKAARALNKQELERLLNEYLSMPIQEIKAKASDPTTPSLHVIVAKIVAEAISKGDQQRLGFLLDRLIGPVPKSLDVKSEEGLVLVVKDYADKK
jgi:hypothetical protein